MLVSGTFIQVDSFGGRTSIDTLQIGSKVYDPVANSMMEVVDILARSIYLDDGRQKLLPVIIRRDEIDSNIPNEDTEFSPEQVLLVPLKMRMMDRYSLYEKRAKDMTRRRVGSPCKVKYYILILADKGHVLANGIVARAHTNESVWG